MSHQDLEDDLEDTAADPALGSDTASGSDTETRTPPLRRRVERPDTDGAPLLEEPAAALEDPDHPEAFGRWLRSQRELRGIGLRAIADSSKISLGHLKALESGRFDLLPAEVFTKGFLRQYSGYVGIDPEEAINFYLAARDHVDEEKDSLDVQSPPKDASGARWVLVALLLVALLLGAIWGLSRLSETADAASDPAPAAGSESAAAPSPANTPDSRSSAVAGTDEAASATQTGGEASASGVGTEDSADPGGGATTDLATESNPDAPDTARDALPGAAVPPTRPAETSQPADVPLRVVLDFSDTCWVSALIDATTTREKVHAQGESLTLDARSSVELKVGNYRAVEVEVNGMPYDLGSRGRAGSVVRTVLIDLEAVRALRGTPAAAADN